MVKGRAKKTFFTFIQLLLKFGFHHNTLYFIEHKLLLLFQMAEPVRLLLYRGLYSKIISDSGYKLLFYNLFDVLFEFWKVTCLIPSLALPTPSQICFLISLELIDKMVYETLSKGFD